ncbi:type-2 angiotensin II receptor [Spea bombifrons]|uniref:type-2 angiotensin II receptor n=1 Tax=Spea bombifrons TaxID=233779 RepID=UPI00234BCEC2|nr:type-2 angiotensin II receptor [Spea bombifrons]
MSMTPSNLTNDLKSAELCRNTSFLEYEFDLIPVFYSIIFILGFIGNSLVITVLCLQGDLKTIASIYILNLAVADLLFLATLPFWAIYYAFRLNWLFGKAMCKISSSLLSLNLFASIFLISCMSVDRYLAIVYPLRSQRRTLRQAFIVVFLVWSLAIFCSFPSFYFRNTYYIKSLGVQACIMDFPEGAYSAWCVALSLLKITLGFCFPMAVIGTCYLMIGLHLKKAKGPAINKQYRDRVLKIVTAIVLAFLICWLPFHLLTFLDALIRMNAVKNCKIVKMVDMAMPFSICLGFTNSCINPLLYCFVGNQFREDFRHLFNFRLSQKTNSQHSTSRKGSDSKEQPAARCENSMV